MTAGGWWCWRAEGLPAGVRARGCVCVLGRCASAGGPPRPALFNPVLLTAVHRLPRLRAEPCERVRAVQQREHAGMRAHRRRKDQRGHAVHPAPAGAVQVGPACVLSARSAAPQSGTPGTRATQGVALPQLTRALLRACMLSLLAGSCGRASMVHPAPCCAAGARMAPSTKTPSRWSTWRP